MSKARGPESGARGRMIKNQSSRRSNCPISVALEMLGDSWTLLVVRDLLFVGATRFNEFLGAEEKIATNILSDRLQRLECAGIIERLPDPEDGRRHINRLTEKGVDLAPVLVEMILWASRYEKTATPPAVVRAMHEDRAGFIANLRARWEMSKSGHPFAANDAQPFVVADSQKAALFCPPPNSNVEAVEKSKNGR